MEGLDKLHAVLSEAQQHIETILGGAPKAKRQKRKGSRRGMYARQFIEKDPGSIPIPGAHKSYRWCQSLRAVISTAKKRPYVMRMAVNGCWNLRSTKGKALYLTSTKLADLLGKNVKDVS